jgi:hypothetical protein
MIELFCMDLPIQTKSAPPFRRLLRRRGSILAPRIDAGVLEGMAIQGGLMAGIGAAISIGQTAYVGQEGA